MKTALLLSLLLASVSFANPSNNTATNNPDDTNQSSDEQTPMVTTQVPANPHDPNAPTLLAAQMPDESELSIANRQLLAKNSELEQQVSNLTAQTQVLVQERSGQLFMYGAMTVLISFIVGVFVGRAIFGRDRW